MKNEELFNNSVQRYLGALFFAKGVSWKIARMVDWMIRAKEQLHIQHVTSRNNEGTSAAYFKRKILIP
jgi:hypothetical protein